MTRSKSSGKFRGSEAIHVEVNNPRLHVCQGSKFVDYEIFIQTSNIAFSRKTSCVRRRYSDFIWLRDKLATNEVNGFASEREVPALPPKRLFGRFEPKFVYSRRNGLQEFLEQVVNTKDYLSYSGLHLFLQSRLPTLKIDEWLEGKYKSELSVDDIIMNEELLERETLKDTGTCNPATCFHIVLSDTESFTFVDGFDDEDAQSFHSSVMGSGESSNSINSTTGYSSESPDRRSVLYATYK